ncbi:MAG: tetratricopeptide repeat protein [Hyphomonadaceae bacterium]
MGLFAGSFWTQHNGSGGEASAATLAASAPAQDAQTLYALARAYEQGEGVSVDLARARSLTERAANEGHLRAMHDLGVFYARGEGGASDDEAALGWFRRAAEAGVTDSQFNVGVFYERGRGVAADNDEALYWFMLAAKSGDDGAAARVSELSADMAPLRVDRARARAEAFVAAGAL